MVSKHNHALRTVCILTWICDDYFLVMTVKCFYLLAHAEVSMQANGMYVKLVLLNQSFEGNKSHPH